MAKKKFKISGMEDRLKSAGLKAIGLGAGAVSARWIGKLPMLTAFPAVAQGAAKIVLGSFLSAVLDNGNRDIMSTIGIGAGDGMVAIGAMELAGSVIPAVAGITGAEEENTMYGMGLLDSDSSTVEGTDQDIDGFEDGVINGTDDVSN